MSDKEIVQKIMQIAEQIEDKKMLEELRDELIRKYEHEKNMYNLADYREIE